VAVVIVVFSSSRIEVLRRQATEARRLGQHVLRERLGAGGMGEVYRAEHVLLRRPCVLKLVRSERAGDPKHLRRFEREVRVTATLTHPNTVQVYDYGHTEDGTFYYVMEYLPGLSLDDRCCSWWGSRLGRERLSRSTTDPTRVSITSRSSNNPEPPLGERPSIRSIKSISTSILFSHRRRLKFSVAHQTAHVPLLNVEHIR
jgi:hypothetical protein